MTVSVVIPSHDRAYIISDALESVFAQTYQDFEILLVDDGSIDDTADVVSRFSDPRLRYIRQEQNRSCGVARNIGLRQASGEYIAFLDSDDTWKPEKLSKDVDFLHRHPEADAVFTDLEKQDGARFVPSFMRESPAMVFLLQENRWPAEIVFTQREMYLCLLQEVPVKPPAFTFRRTTLEDVGYFDESWRSGSDWDFFLRFSKRHRLGYIDEPLTVIRVQSDAIHRRNVVAEKPQILAMLQAESRAAQDSEVRAAATKGYYDTTRYLSWAYLRRGQKLNASLALARGFLVTRHIGLLARSIFALIRPSSES